MNTDMILRSFQHTINNKQTDLTTILSSIANVMLDNTVVSGRIDIRSSSRGLLPDTLVRYETTTMSENVSAVVEEGICPCLAETCFGL